MHVIVGALPAVVPVMAKEQKPDPAEKLAWILLVGRLLNRNVELDGSV